MQKNINEKRPAKMKKVNINKKIIGRLVSVDGEILKEIYEGDSYTSKDQQTVRNNYQSYINRINNNNNQWIGCIHDNIKSISNSLSLINAGAIMKLLPYIKFNSNGLLFCNNNPMSTKEIELILNRSTRGTSNILKELIELDVLTIKKKGKINTYYINNKYHTFGKMLKGHSNFTKIFINKIKEVSTLLNLNELGLLYKIIPYFHYEFFSLCSNPDENDITMIDYINKEQLATIVNCNTKVIYNITNKLHNNYLLLTIKSGKQINYIIHPDLMYRKQLDSTTYFETVRQFERLKEAKNQ